MGYIESVSHFWANLMAIEMKSFQSHLYLLVGSLSVGLLAILC